MAATIAGFKRVDDEALVAELDRVRIFDRSSGL
jgi:hypothetical protein